MKSVVVFTVAGLLFGLAALGVGYGFGDDRLLLQGAVAFGLAFVPAAATLAWVSLSYQADHQMILLASLGGSGIRLAIALGGAWMLANWQPDTFTGTFWLWLILFYLVLLTFEITILVRQQRSDA
jgi:hypothetical protein